MKFSVKIAGIFAVVAFALTAVSANAAFTRDLTLGSTGADVIELQTVLEQGKYLTIPAGTSKGYFGALTKTAVAKWQAAVGLPSTGYFGPMSRAKLAAMPSTGGNTGGSTSGDLEGGDGDFDEYDVLGNPDTTDVEEGETEEVLAIEFDAQDSDLLIERVDALFSATGATTDKPWKVLDTITLSIDGEEVADIDASESDAWDEEATDEYSIRFEDIDTKVEEGETAKVVISVTAQDNLDDDDLGEWTLAIMNDGIRALNADGIQVYEGDADTIAAAADERTFTLELATIGDLSLSVDDDENEDRTVEVDEDDDTNDEVIYIAKAESQDGDNTIEEVTVTIATTTSTTNGLSDFVKTLYLFIDGDEVGSETVSEDDGSEAILFDDLDVTIDEDEELDFEVRADFDNQDGNYATTTTGVYVTQVEIDFVDAQDDDQTETDTTDGGDITLSVDALAVEVADLTAAEAPLANDESQGRFFVEFTVTAPENEDIYIPYGATTSTAVASGKGAEFLVVDSSGASVTATTTDSNNVLKKVSGASDTGSYYKITEGNTATFSLEVIVSNTGATSARTLGIQLTGVNYKVGSAATPDNQFTSGIDEDFRSKTAYLLTSNTSN